MVDNYKLSKNVNPNNYNKSSKKDINNKIENDQRS